MGSEMCVLAAASCHAASRLFGESESVISLDPALQGHPAPPAISLEPQRLNGQVIDTRMHTHTDTQRERERASLLAPTEGHISLVIKTCRGCLTSTQEQQSEQTRSYHHQKYCKGRIIRKQPHAYIMAHTANESCNCKCDSTLQPPAVMSTRHCLNDSNEIDADSPSMNDSSYEDVCWE